MTPGVRAPAARAQPGGDAESGQADIAGGVDEQIGRLGILVDEAAPMNLAQRPAAAMARRRKYPGSSGCPRIRPRSPPASSSTSTRCPSGAPTPAAAPPRRTELAGKGVFMLERAQACRRLLAAGARTRIETRLPLAARSRRPGLPANVSSTYPDSSITDDQPVPWPCLSASKIRQRLFRRCARWRGEPCSCCVRS